MNNFSLLPKEIINKILEYSGGVVYRNGVYIDRLQKSDSRYKLLKTINLPIFGNNMATIQLLNKENGLYINLIYYYGKGVSIGCHNITCLTQSIEKFDKKTYKKSYDGKWWATVEYVM